MGICCITQGTHRLPNNLEGWDGEGGGREFKREGVYVYLWLIHADVWQKPTKFCKTIILQLKNQIRSDQALSRVRLFETP